MMKGKLLALLLALALFCAACAPGEAGRGESSSPEAAPPPAVTAREIPLDAAGGTDLCLAVKNGQALFHDLSKKYPEITTARNTLRVNLATGETEELGFWSPYVQWDGGDTYYWVGMTGPVTRYGENSFGIGGGSQNLSWQEWIQEGIWRGNARGEGELLYLLPEGEDREIQSLELQGKYLSWGELVRPSHETVFSVLNLESGELRSWREKDTYSWWVDGGCLFSWNRREVLRAESLDTGEEVFNRWVEGLTRAFYDDGRVIWNEGAGGFHVYDCRTEKTLDLSDPDASPGELVWEMELIRGRYLVYRVEEHGPEGTPDIHRGLRVFDLEAGEVFYRSADDPAVEKRENWCYNQMVVDREAGMVLLVGREHEMPEYWAFTDKMALSVFTLA